MIGISLLTLVPGVAGGSEVYARELIRALARVGELEYRVFAPRIAPDVVDGLPGTTVRSYRASRRTAGRAGAMALATAVPGPIRRELEVDQLDAIHFPLTTEVPRVRRPPVATTVHDLGHELHPEHFSSAELAYRRLAYRPSIRRSRLVIVPSEHVREVVVERYELEPAHVRVVPHGLDHERFRPQGRARAPFLLYPANRWPHKNHDRLFQAFALIRRQRPELTLVLTGSGHRGRPAPEGVEVRGRVSLDELAELYATASALVFPSLHEGFGQPPLEAMACGCPVAVAHAGSLPEICGDAACYFDPRSSEHIAEAVLALLAAPGEYVQRGLHRAAGFSWERSARGHEAVYREITGETTVGETGFPHEPPS